MALGGILPDDAVRNRRTRNSMGSSAQLLFHACYGSLLFLVAEALPNRRDSIG
jgi:hypothetical protein